MTISEPALVAVYGPTGVGKTVDAYLACPTAFVIGAPGCTKGVASFFGSDIYAKLAPRWIPGLGFQPVINTLTRIIQKQLPPDPVIIDDFSMRAADELAGLRATYPSSHTRQLWTHFDTLILTIRNLARNAGVHVLITAHTREASTSERGEFTPAGPDCGGPKALRTFVGALDVCYEAKKEKAFWPYPLAYYNEPSALVSHKDRHSVFHGRAPANLHEILRRAGLQLTTIKPLLYLDNITERLTAQLLDLSSDKARRDKCREFMEKARQNFHEGHMYLVVRNAYARAWFVNAPSMIDGLLADEPDESADDDLFAPSQDKTDSQPEA